MTRESEVTLEKKCNVYAKSVLLYCNRDILPRKYSKKTLDGICLRKIVMKRALIIWNRNRIELFRTNNEE